MSRSKSNWIDITDILTDKGVEALKAGKDVGIRAGQVLRFKQEISGTPTDMKITRMDKKTGRVWGKETRLYDSDDVEVVDK